MAPKKNMAPKKFLSEEMVLDSDSDYEQKEQAPVKGKARATSKVTKKRTAASAIIGEEPQSKHQKTFHPKPARFRGKQPVSREKEEEEEKAVDFRPSHAKRMSNIGDEDQSASSAAEDKQESKKIVERITGVAPGSSTRNIDPSGASKGERAQLSEEKEAEVKPKTSSKDQSGGQKASKKTVDRAPEPTPESSTKGDLSAEKDVKDFSNRRDRNPSDLTCIYRVNPSSDLTTHFQNLKASNPTLPDFLMRGPIESPGLYRFEGDMKNWRDHIRTHLKLEKYGLSLSFVFAKVDNAEGKAIAEPPALPIFSKHKKATGTFDALIARMSHAEAAKVTFVLKFEVGEEVLEE